MNIIVENFNLFSLLKIFFIKRNKIKFKDINIFYDSFNTKIPFFIFQFFFSNKIKKLNWKFRELTSKNGINLFYDLLHNELEKILIEIIASIKKRDKIFNKDGYVYLEYYFFKFLSSSKIHPFSNKSVLDIIFFINVIEKIFLENNQSYKTIIIMNKIPWRDIFSNYAAKKNINIYFVNLSFIKLNLYLIFNNLKSILKYLKNIANIKLWGIKIDNLKISKKKFSIVIETSLQINSASKFMSKSKLNFNDAIHVNSSYELPKNEIKDILKSERNYVYLSSSPPKSNELNFYCYNKLSIIKNKFKNFNKYEKIICNNIFSDFEYEKNMWKDFFKSINAKIYLTGFFMSNHTIAATAAIKQLNGISSVFTDSYYEFSNPQTSCFTDIYFSPATNTVHDLKKDYGFIKAVVGVGYINSYKFENLKLNSTKIRKKLINNKAKKIIAFYDQGEINDDKWSMGYDSSLEGYIFLMEKLLANEWMGLIIKPKKPGLLSEKLSKIEDLISKCKKTGRFYIYDQAHEMHVKNFLNPPSESAMAADLAIHDTLVSATAGLEAYLSGTRTVLFDRYYFKASRFYKALNNKIAFTNWKELWENIEQYFKFGNKNFGNWSSIINDIDPFQDGNSDLRLGNFLKLLLDEFESKEDIDLVIHNSAHKYSSEWGKDKILF